jgi:hypothetical protein
MNGSASQTAFIGGAGRQYMTGGSGPKIFKYLAISESIAQHPDVRGNFHPAQDVIELDRRRSHFAFIGTASFSSSGGQVRYQCNPATNQTVAKAELFGDTMALNDYPDLLIDLAGNLNLTPANFGLNGAEPSSRARRFNRRRPAPPRSWRLCPVHSSSGFNGATIAGQITPA